MVLYIYFTNTKWKDFYIFRSIVLNLFKDNIRRWRGWMWRSWAVVWLHVFCSCEVNYFPILRNDIAEVVKLFNFFTFNSRATVLGDIPTVSMSVAYFLKTSKICGIVLCNKWCIHTESEYNFFTQVDHMYYYIVNIKAQISRRCVWCTFRVLCSGRVTEQQLAHRQLLSAKELFPLVY